MMSRTEALEALGKMLASAGVVMTIATALHGVVVSLEVLKVDKELEKIMGKEWVEACWKDEQCYSKLIEIAKESFEAEAKIPEKERKRYREKLLEELRKKLEEIGVEFWCEEKDLGELGTLYEDCYIEYKGELFSITADIGA